ncbi:polysaccharide deacetylase family sporulation protein PdaB [Calorimonas adulescens]|uniref:Polysaccharide deacetylase family sporulation protein PdaB n=1 Tax=Calorimonas adulescens TaxID=2606906 RepID=A0A5D8QES4_9THEO|nr:polysaccharide deacetylase family sporulation protein PdaB [Calorimonas adulescens]TZE81748.1 polysaccharide deacetylase family sporulation protein PdaB [Calorimonas adulescens]
MRIIYIEWGKLIKVCIVFVLVGVSLIYYNGLYTGIISVFAPQREIPIYCVDTPQKKVAITFDASWGAENTAKILDILDHYNAKATFFLVGIWVDDHPDMVKEIARRKHEIGNHSTSHPHMNSLSESEIEKELTITTEKIKALTGKDVKIFRPPFGEYNNRVVLTAKRLGYYVIQWDVDSLDWKGLSADAMADRILPKVKEGSIVLFHNDGEHTPEVLPTVLNELKERGYSFVTVSELIYKDNYYIDHRGMQHLQSNNLQ